MLSGLHYRAVKTCGPILLLFAGAVIPAASAADTAAKVDFPHTIVPILKAHCVECHGGHRHAGDFTINTREAILKAGVVEPGKAADSHLIDLVTSDDKKERMPKDKPALSATDVNALRNWIDEGMPWEAGFTFATRDHNCVALGREVVAHRRPQPSAAPCDHYNLVRHIESLPRS